MNRLQIIEAIVTEYRKAGYQKQENVLRESLRHIASDTSLLALAAEVGVNTMGAL